MLTEVSNFSSVCTAVLEMLETGSGNPGRLLSYLMKFCTNNIDPKIISLGSDRLRDIEIDKAKMVLMVGTNTNGVGILLETDTSWSIQIRSLFRQIASN
jgi:hypothetical protein